MLHVTCDEIDIVQYHLLKSKMAAMHFENARNRTKTVLVTLIALNTRNLSKIVML